MAEDARSGSESADASFSLPAYRLPSGAQMPSRGLGTWDLRGADAYRAVRSALDLGYRHIDTATAYDNEADVGRAIRDSGIARDEIFVVTKLPKENVGREAATLNASLQALSVDYVDLWLIHWPPGDADLVRCWKKLTTERERGRARDTGVSNHSNQQIEMLAARTGVLPAVNQIRWSPRFFDKAALEHSLERGYLLVGHSPFISSDLREPLLAEIAARHCDSAAAVILRWYSQHGVVAIPKAATNDHLSQNIEDRFRLTTGEMQALDAMSGLLWSMSE